MRRPLSIVRTAFATLLLVTLALSVPHRVEAATRPRIGLALSGGGALGLAHVGVLKYFEEHHIPVDGVAGTSMGGLVGGLYATGLDAAALDHIARTAEWDELLRTSPKYRDRSIAEKQKWFSTEQGITLRFKRDLSLPSGVNPGQPLALMLSRYTAAYGVLGSFDELPTPFRCVSTDLTHGTAYTLDHGQLALAMRATMAIPGIFTPVRWEGRILVDGGVVDNIPVDVARAMHNDVAIAVSLETAAPTQQSLSTLTGVLRQVVNVVVTENERRSLAQADLVIAVPLANFTALDYQDAGKIVDAGYAAAAAMAARLRPYELGDAAWADYQRQRASRLRTMPERGRIVAVSSPQKIIETDAAHELNRKLPGETTREQLEATLTGVSAATSLPAAYYTWGADGSAEPGYRVHFQQRENGGEVLLRPSLTMQASSGEPTRVALRISGVGVRGTDYKARLLTETSIGYNPGLRLEYYHPFDGKAYFVAPGLVMQRTNDPGYEGTAQQDNLRDRYAGTLYAGLGTWRFVQWRVGTTAGYDRVNHPLTTNGVTSKSSSFANLETTLLVDKQDALQPAMSGERMALALGYRLAERSYPYLTGEYRRTIPIMAGGLSAFVSGRGESAFGRKLGYYDQFTSGGFAHMDAYRVDEFRANSLAEGGVGLFLPMPLVKLGGWQPGIAAWHAAGEYDLGSQGWQRHQSSSIGIFGKSPLAPMGLVLSVSEQGRLRLRFVFGRF